MIVKFKKKDESTEIPVKGTVDSAAYDVHVHSISYPADNKVCVGLGFYTEIPRGYKGIIVPRSNLTKYDWVLNNSHGVIDCDYRGEWMAIFTSLKGTTAYNPFPYQIGDRCAQIYFDKADSAYFHITDELGETTRGEGGFGSTGV
jgi:dUTP pyrophosphatase